ncbi:MAG: hypothetical protein KC488_01680 [Candidatus Cloacimonetes bacterium]|nr:hypothetical protein [Candidatus Cloacimonadota bacterium]
MSAPVHSARVRVRYDGGCHAQGSGPSFPVGEPLGIGADRTAPSSLDLALAALASELLNLLYSLCQRSGLALDSLELSLTATLDNPLVALGVVGESGCPTLATIHGVCHVVCLEEEAMCALPVLWEQACARAVLLNSLRRGCPVSIRLNLL